MATDERSPIKVEGEPSKPRKLWRVDHTGKQISLVAEAHTREELSRLYKCRADWNYRTYHWR